MALTGLPINLEVGLTGVGNASRTLDNLTNQRRVVQLSARLDTRSILSAQKALGQISNNASEFEKSMQAANARVLAFGSAVGVIEGMRRSFVALIKTTVDVENALVKIASISQDSLSKAGVSIDQYGRQLFKIAKETGQTFDEVGKAALEFARQGLAPIETLKRTKDALILTRLSGLDAVASVEALTAAYNTFKGEVSGTNQILQKLVAVDNASAASAGDLAEGLQRAGFIAKDTGQTLDEVIATIATLQEVTARGGAVVGNAFKTILTRAQSLENLKLFEGLGVDTSVEGKVKPTIQLLQELAQIVNSPNFTGGKTNILSKLAGNFQINQLSAFVDVLKDVGESQNIYTRNLENSKNATDQATQQNKKYGETLAASLNTANLSVEEFLNSLGKVGIKDPFSGLIDRVSSFFGLLQEGVDSEGLGGDIARGIVKGIGGVLFSNTGLALVGFALVKIVKDFVQFSLNAAKGFLDFNRSSKEQERIQTSISSILSTNQGILSGIANTEQGRVILAQRVADIYERQLNAATALSQITKGAATAIYNEGYRVKDGGVTRPRARAAEGFDPLVAAEMRDVKKGVGGANPNSKIVVMPNFPFGGGKKGLMVANSSETAYKSGTGYGIMNPDQMRNSGRAADGFSLPKATLQNKKGRFTDQRENIEVALQATVSLMVGWGKSVFEINNAIRASLKSFDLNKKSFELASKAANDHARALEKEAVAGSAAAKVSAQRVSGGSSTTFGASGKIANQQASAALAQRQAAIQARAVAVRNVKDQQDRLQKVEIRIGETKKRLSEIQSKPKGEQSAFSSEKSGLVTALRTDSLNQNLGRSNLSYLRAKAEAMGIDLTSLDAGGQSRQADTRALKERLQAKYSNYSGGSTMFGSGGNSRSPIAGLSAVDQRTPVPAAEGEKVKKTFGDSLGKLAILAVAAEGLGSAFGDAKEAIGKFTGFLSQAGIGLYAISELSNFGGKSLKDLIPSFGGGKSNFGRGFRVGKAGKDSSLAFAESNLLSSSASARAGRFAGGVAGGIGTAISGITSLGKFLPIVGQVVVGLGILYEGVRVFAPDLFEGIRLAFGGLTKSAQKAGEDFKKLSEEVFDITGKFTGKSNQETVSSFNSRIKEIEGTQEARRKGLDTTGLKNPQEIQTALFEKIIRSQFGQVQTGGTVLKSNKGSNILTKENETFANLSPSSQNELFVVAGKLASQRDDDLKTLLAARGDKSAAGANTEELRKKIVSAFLSDVAKGIAGGGLVSQRGKTNPFFESEGGVKYLQQKAAGFKIPDKSPAERAFALDLSTVDEAKRELSFIIQQQNVRKDLTSLEERALNVRLRGLDITAEETFELEKQKKLLSFIEGEESSLLQKAQEIFNTSLKKAEETRVGGIPLDELENARSILKRLEDKRIDKSSGTAVDIVKEASLALVGGGYDVFANEQGRIYKDSVESIKKINALKKESLDLDIKDSEETFRLEQARKRELSILESTRKLSSLASDGRSSGIESSLSLLRQRGGFSSTSPQQKNILDAQASFLEENLLTKQLFDNTENYKNALQDLEKTRASIGEDDFSKKEQVLAKELENANKKILAQKNALIELRGETASGIIVADKFAASQERFSRTLSSLSVLRSRSAADISGLNARANDPSLGILGQESARRNINQKTIDDLKNNGRTDIELQFSKAQDAANQELDPSRKKSLLNDAKDAREKEINALNAQVSELEISTSQIGKTKSSFTALDDAILQFSRGLGESRGQNQFNTLQATDPSSIVGGLIGEQVYGQAEGKTGEKLVSFIAEQNALLNEQFKINTAANASEKFELENQLELTKAILDIKNQNLDPAEKQLKIEEAINANLEKRRSFKFGVGQAVSGIQTEIQTFGADFGKTATDGFRDGLVGAMQAAVSQTDNLKGALLDVALSFANKLRDAALTNLANIITRGLGGGGGSGGIVSGVVGAIGGLFSKKATGGLITGGSGSKDDVPTLLMGGEYVVNKKAVNAYGKNFFESLNRGSVGQMAQGGYFAPGVRGQGTISGKENLLDFATQTATTGKGDVISSLGAGAGLVSLEPESLRLSNFGRFGDSPIVQATQEAKEQAFGLYLDQLGAEKDYQAQLDAIKKAEKEKKKQFLISLATAVVGAGLSYAAGSFGSGGSKAAPKALDPSKPYSFNSKSGLYQYSNAASGANSGGGILSGIAKSIGGAFRATAYGNADIDKTTARDQALANAGNPAYKGFSQTVGASGRSLIPGYSVASNFYPLGTILSVNGQNYRVDDRGGMSKNVVDFYAGSDRNLYNKYANFGKINPQVIRRNAGGSVSGNGDTVPAMLSNKEFVLNSSAAQKIGDKGLYALNNGANTSGGDSETRIVSKLDELIEKTVGASNITINVSTGGGNGEKEESDNSQQSDSNSNEKQRFLMQRLKESVLNVIRDEQRPGGLLTSTRR